MVKGFPTLSRRQFLLAALLAPFAQIARDTRFLTYDQVAPLFRARAVALPPELSALSETQLQEVWPRWIQERDREIRSRLLRGEEDTLANFVLFGLSFTSQPRVTPDVAADPSATERLIQGRILDFVAAIATPSRSEDNERLALLQNLISRLGHQTNTPEDRERLERYVAERISRYAAEQQQFTRDLDAAITPASEIYRDRGLSLDTNFQPNYAIEQALADLKNRGVLTSVRRAAVIGPGLDFTDKDSGFDFYPLQTLQPFALIDSLLRLELAQERDLQVSVFDISSQTLDHIERAVSRARSGQEYTLQLVLDRGRGWNDPTAGYWRRLGDRLGDSVEPLPIPPQIQGVEQRAVRIRPGIVAKLAAHPLNLVAQHLALPSGDQYDLIIATNVFVYYTAFEQALALLNIEAMMPNGAIFLSNDIPQSFTGTGLTGIGSIDVEYSSTQTDRVRAFTRSAFTPRFW